MSPLKKIFEKQLLHLLYLMLLLAGLFLFSKLDGFDKGKLWGVETITWFYLLVGITVIHQVFVWFCWRTELYAGWLSGWFGHRAFAVYAFLFFLLIISRPVFMTFLAIATMMGVVLVSQMGLKFLPLGRLERYSHAAAGAAVCICGLAIKFLGL